MRVTMASLPALLLLSFFSILLLLPKAQSMLNQMDICWRANPMWADYPQALADCALGFGGNALGGKLGNIYVVNDTSDDAMDPQPGTLRYGVIQEEPLWIIFERDMTLKFKNELIVGSHKTIDGRGVKVEITGGPCITIRKVSHVIIHGLDIHDCKRGKKGMVRIAPGTFIRRGGADGDAIAVYGSSHVWIDHCNFQSCADGLVDVIHASTAITISNCYFAHHDKVMLLGHNDNFKEDKIMKVTVAFNHFGPGLVQRMPRVRWGYAHVVNNKYDPFESYAIGGSADPTIFSQGNYFDSPLEVTRRMYDKGWKSWKWRSSEDEFVDGAFFVPSGSGSCEPGYSSSHMIIPVPGTMAPMVTADAGVLDCIIGAPCVFH